MWLSKTHPSLELSGLWTQPYLKLAGLMEWSTSASAAKVLSCQAEGVEWWVREPQKQSKNTFFSAGCCVAQTRSVSQELLRWLKKKRPWESFTNVGKMRRWFVPAFVSMGAYYVGAMTKLLEYHVWPTLQSTTKSWLCFKTFSVPCKRAPSHHVWGSSGRRCGCFEKILGKYWDTQNVLNKRFAI